MLDRTSAPQFAEIENFSLPVPQVIKLDNDVSLIHFDEVNQDVVKIELVFKAGRWFETKSGIAHFTAQMLEKGTHKKNSFQIAEIFDQYGSSVEISAGFDYTSVSLFTLSKNSKHVLPLLCEIISTPSFPENEFELMKSISKQNLRVNNEKNSYVAGKTIRHNIFGTHPYGNSLEEQDIDALTVDDLRDFFNKRFSLYEIYITGKLNFSELEIQQVFSALIGLASSADPEIKPVIRKSFAQHIPKPDSLQCSIRLGKRIINRNHPDYPTLVLLNHVLGGYFGSRLMKNIREEKGLTYGINSSLSVLKNDAFFMIGTDVNQSNRILAVSEIKKEIEKLRKYSIEPAELEAAKNHLLGSLQLETANPFSVVEKIKVVRLNQLPSDFYTTLFSEIQHSTSESVMHVASHLHENDLFEVSVG